MELHQVNGHEVTVALPPYVCLALSRAARAAELLLSGCYPDKECFAFDAGTEDTDPAVMADATLYGVLATAMEALALASYQHGYIGFKHERDASLESLRRKRAI